MEVLEVPWEKALYLAYVSPRVVAAKTSRDAGPRGLV